jgi:hypothetical protein
MRPVAQIKQAAMEYPIHTQSHDCHHDRPATIMEDEIIHVLMLKESAIQKPTKFHAPHCRRAGSTGLRSWFVNCVHRSLCQRRFYELNSQIRTSNTARYEV